MISQLRNLASHFFLHKTPDRTITHEWFTGNFDNFRNAKALCRGYDHPIILEKVKSALLAVKRGEAAYERDSVLFDRTEYSMPLLSFLLFAATASNNKLNLLDFGGSLGSTFFQNRKFLEKLTSIQWSIVEQENFVQCGREYFTDATLNFFETIEQCVHQYNPNTILLSSVLPYLPDPFETLEKIINHGFDFIIIDRTPFFTENLPDRLTIEHVPAEIYDAEYPAWFFNLDKFIKFMTKSYRLFEQFDSWENWTIGGDRAQSKCLLFERLK